MIQEGLSMRAAAKNRLIADIKANKANTFSDEQLNGFELHVLEAMAALAAPVAQPLQTLQHAPAAPVINYAPRGAPAAPTSQVETSESEARVNADENSDGAPMAPKVFSKAEDFSNLPGARKRNSQSAYN
jgi:hypothetical protein